MTEATKQIPGYMKFILSALAGITASALLQPLDLIKTRMQVSHLVGKNEYKNVFDGMLKVMKNEGILKLWQGLDASLARQATYTATRMGVYQALLEFFKNNISPSPSVASSMIMAMIAGAAGASVGNPAEVALIRLLSDHNLPPAQKRNYRNAADAFWRIHKEEGRTGLWKGCGATTGRAMVVNMCQLASYSHAKNYLREKPFEMQEDFHLHVSASIFSGLLSAVASLPLDIAKTHIQSRKPAPGINSKYKGTIGVLKEIVRREGLSALWEGLTLYFFRMTSSTVLMFVILEQFDKLYYNYVIGTEGKSQF